MKIPVMTIPYNISLNGVTSKLIDLLVQEKSYNKADKTYNYKIRPEFCINNESVILNSSEFGTLSAFIYNSLYKTAPLLKELVAYFNEMIKLVYSLNLPVTWITPAGMKINLSYIEYKAVKTKTVLFKNSSPITLNIPTNNLNKLNIKLGFMPNMIHSMDATNIHILLNNLYNDGHRIPIYTIHDCFATTPNNMSLLNDYTISAFIELYLESNYFATQLLKRTR
jgi:DNA-directed RNA polymerase